MAGCCGHARTTPFRGISFAHVGTSVACCQADSQIKRRGWSGIQLSEAVRQAGVSHLLHLRGSESCKSHSLAQISLIASVGECHDERRPHSITQCFAHPDSCLTPVYNLLIQPHCITPKPCRRSGVCRHDDRIGALRQSSKPSPPAPQNVNQALKRV